MKICTVNASSKLMIGSQTKFMGECHIIASECVTIGAHCAISWNTQIMDTDFHHIYKGDELLNQNKAVEIGNHVWIASHSLIMKGSVIPDYVVVAAGSIINGNKTETLESNTIITGLPNRTLRDSITWEM